MDKGVSIIIPCHYQWEYVEECLDSVLQQRMDSGIHNQVICVYNEAYDKDNNLLNRLKAQRGIDLVLNYHGYGQNRKLGNYGAASARNTGLSHVKKDTVMFIDDDDKIGWTPAKNGKKEGFDPYYLQHFYDVLQQPNITYGDKIVLGYNKPVSMVTGDIIKTEIYEKYGLDTDTFTNYDCIPSSWLKNKRPFTLDKVLQFLNGRNSSCAVLYRTDIINKYNLKFNTDLRYHEDTDFVMRYALSASYEHKYILATVRQLMHPEWSESYYWYRKNPSSVMGEINQISDKKWSSITRQADDSLFYYASMMETVKNREDLGMSSQIYRRLSMDFRSTVRKVQEHLESIATSDNPIRPEPQNAQKLVEMSQILPEHCLTCKILYNTEKDACLSCPFGNGGPGGASGSGTTTCNTLPEATDEYLKLRQAQNRARKFDDAAQYLSELLHNWQKKQRSTLQPHLLYGLSKKELADLSAIIAKEIKKRDEHTK